MSDLFSPVPLKLTKKWNEINIVEDTDLKLCHIPQKYDGGRIRLALPS